MEKRKLTEKIMHRVADREEQRLKKLLLIFGPLTLILFLLVLETFHRTVMRLIDREFFKVLVDFKSGEELITSHVIECLTLCWLVIEKGILSALILSLLILIIIWLKTDLFSSPRRLKQIKKFKNETFSSSPRTISRKKKNDKNLLLAK
jgi:hypothetical protein